ncbi:hypothetical protein B0A55_04698 [Friedmanniomyces simplex]|uniref:Transcription factor TFIIIC triple barrel domain-containing protein n=1 Tax=Friedmanniomyces simplex TaxID=329884 RepID=A0A4U0XQA0_9PEZI|nr:hypothetical protein B0A55_04698 [Friedmanniomyces simplex]
MDEQSDEWEYEYDLRETEDLYFTLDLTTHVPEAIAAHQVLRNGKRATKEAVSRPTDDGAPGLGNSHPAQQPAGSLQFLDLHTQEPLVRFNEGVYSCNWHTDLGTQFFVSQPGSISKPVRPGHVLDVVGTSQTKLLGRPVKLHQRKAWADDTPRDSPQKPADGPGFDSGRMLAATLPPSELSNLRPGQQLVIPLDAIKKPEQAAQASFLEKLSAIKLQKGEHDIIPVAGVKHYPPPANKDEIRQRALATAAAAQNIMPADPPPSMPPAGKRRRITFAEMGLETKAAKKRRLKQEALAGKGPDERWLEEKEEEEIHSSRGVAAVLWRGGAEDGVMVARASAASEALSAAETTYKEAVAKVAEYRGDI